MAALSEGMALAEKCDLDQVTLLEVSYQVIIMCFSIFLIDSITWCPVLSVSNWKRVSNPRNQLPSQLSSEASTGSEQYFLSFLFKPNSQDYDLSWWKNSL